MPEDLTPILVGCGEVTDLATPVERGRSPFDLIAQAGRLALADAGGSGGGIAQAIDTMAMLRLFADTSHRFATKLGSSTNPPKSVADRLGLRPARNIYTWNGGNMPQYLVNLFAEAIARGEIRAALLERGGGPAQSARRDQLLSVVRERNPRRARPLGRSAHAGDGKAVRPLCRGGGEESAGDAPRGLYGRASRDRRCRQSLGRLSLSAADELQRIHRPGRGLCHDLGRDRAQPRHPGGELGVCARLRGYQ